MTAIIVVTAFIAGWVLWTFAEYVLHRFAMHELDGKGIMSREHLEHHVHSGWSFDVTHLMSWAGMLLVGAVAWAPLGWVIAGPAFGVTLAIGWAFGYFFYEYQHMAAHLRGPRNRYETFVRKHHFHHHFGHPKSNHGVSIALWDRVFGTFERPDSVRVPRRLALPWLVDESGKIKDEFSADYTLVGSARADERTAALDRARAFASLAPVD
ncbi:MAG: sterol desaturase family protein [Microthrixaceae bacterium]|nr:sterol desaturase family protein [Microthrixaceae bacterium]